jgi:hypothetical protein
MQLEDEALWLETSAPKLTQKVLNFYSINLRKLTPIIIFL